MLDQTASQDQAKSETADRLYLSTGVRAARAVEDQMVIAGSLYDETRYRAYLKMLETATTKRDTIFRSLIIIDSILVIIALGQPVQIPALAISLDKLPAVVEILLLVGAMGFYFTVVTFQDWLIYAQISEQYYISKVKFTGVDPGFLTASDRYMDLHLKMISLPRVNIWGKDFDVPGKGARAFFRFHHLVMLTILLSYPVAHFLSVYLGLKASASRLEPLHFYIYASIIIGLNLLTLMVAIGHNVQWRYSRAEYAPPYMVPNNVDERHIPTE
jgi:hypothetical protein